MRMSPGYSSPIPSSCRCPWKTRAAGPIPTRSGGGQTGVVCPMPSNEDGHRQRRPSIVSMVVALHVGNLCQRFGYHAGCHPDHCVPGACDTCAGQIQCEHISDCWRCPFPPRSFREPSRVRHEIPDGSTCTYHFRDPSGNVTSHHRRGGHSDGDAIPAQVFVNL